MKIYLVGGAVRDQLLGLPIKERDWVVVGATPAEMLTLGFQPVGKDFPVFLHPETHEEYALARTERKTGKGYKGFTFYAERSVALEEDLKRRDLSVNAIAQDSAGNLIDPFNGQQDLKNKIFRHVSAAFAEDPVRILRLARFSARFSDFTIHQDTQQLMQQMVDNGEVSALVAERVWQELRRALDGHNPVRFFQILHQCGALEQLFPEIDITRDGVRRLSQALDCTNPVIRLAIVTHDLDLSALQTLIKRLKVPNNFKALMLLLAQKGALYKSLDPSNPEAMLRLLLDCDALRRKARFDDFLSACQYCFGKNIEKKQLLQKALNEISTLSTEPLQKKNLSGKAFSQQLQKMRLEAIKTCLSTK